MRIKTGINLSVLCAITLLLAPSQAHADMGLPMLAVVWPGSWILFIPITILEAAVARKILNTNWKQSLKISAVANAASSVAGIPIAWLSLLLPFGLLGALIFYLPLPESIKPYLMIPFYALWLPPITAKQAWMVPLSAAILCIPFFYASIIIETGVGKKMLASSEIEIIRKWAWKANVYSYGAIVVVLIGLTIWHLV
jgi:hypothetical protein